MEKTITLSLTNGDVGQILDGLRSRAQSWEQTAHWMSQHKNGHDMKITDDVFLIEECNSVIEAEQIAQSYRDIIDSVEAQIEEQNSQGDV